MPPSQEGFGGTAGTHHHVADIMDIRAQARTQWLKPAVILSILQNFQAYQFPLDTTPPNRPESGSLFLFDSTVQRNLRKDGHNWQLKPGGRSVKESHVELKVGNRKVLDCYYAHGNGDDRFQRRIYWQLAEKNLKLVHYLRVEEGIGRIRPSITNIFRFVVPQRANSQALEVSQGSGEDGADVDNGVPEGITQTIYPNPGAGQSPTLLPFHSSLLQQYDPRPEGTIPPPSFTHQANAQFSGLGQSETGGAQATETLLVSSDSFDFEPNRDTRQGLWDGLPSKDPPLALPENLETQPLDEGVFPSEAKGIFLQRRVAGKLCRSLGGRMEPGPLEDVLERVDLNDAELPEASNISLDRDEWKDNFLPFNEFSHEEVEDMQLDSFGTNSLGRRSLERCSTDGRGSLFGNWSRSLERCSTGGIGGSWRNSSPLIDFNKLDSFSKWGHEIYGEQNTPEPSNTGKSAFIMEEPSFILFEVNDVSPSICCTEGGTKVIIIGRTEMHENRKWGVLFDNVEVSAELIQPGVLRCHAPPHVKGAVTIAVTLSDGSPCSKLLQIKYEKPTVKPNHDEENLQIRLVHLLLETQREESSSSGVKDEWKWLTEVSRKDDRPGFVHEQLMLMLIRRQVVIWANGPNAEVRLKHEDDGGLAAIHMVAALGYDWAISTLAEKLDDLDLPDRLGRTPLHWAAANGREKVIFNLLNMGATPAPLVKLQDCQEGVTPADLASWYGHKGIAAQLAGKALQGVRNQIPCSEMSSVSLKDRVERAGTTAVNKYRNAVGTETDGFLAMEEAIRQGAENSELITFVDRNHSRKKLGLDRVEVVKSEDVETEAGLKLLSAIIKQDRKKKTGWNGSRASTLKIQQHVPGRKNRSIVWPVRQNVVCLVASVKGRAEIKAAYERHRKLRFAMGIIEKVILRWRRGRRGLIDFDSFGKLGGKPALVGDKVVVHYLPPEKIPQDPPIKKGPHGDWRNVGGKGAGILRACRYLNTLRSSLSGREQYGRLKRMATLKLKGDH